RVVRRLQGGQHSDGKADPAAAAAARLHAGGAAGSHVLARDLLVAAAQLRAGEIAVIRARLLARSETTLPRRRRPRWLARRARRPVRDARRRWLPLRQPSREGP